MCYMWIKLHPKQFIILRGCWNIVVHFLAYLHVQRFFGQTIWSTSVCLSLNHFFSTLPTDPSGPGSDLSWSRTWSCDWQNWQIYFRVSSHGSCRGVYPGFGYDWFWSYSWKSKSMWACLLDKTEIVLTKCAIKHFFRRLCESSALKKFLLREERPELLWPLPP